jgi:hypothetical protein
MSQVSMFGLREANDSKGERESRTLTRSYANDGRKLTFLRNL